MATDTITTHNRCTSCAYGVKRLPAVTHLVKCSECYGTGLTFPNELAESVDVVDHIRMWDMSALLVVPRAAEWGYKVLAATAVASKTIGSFDSLDEADEAFNGVVAQIRAGRLRSESL